MSGQTQIRTSYQQAGDHRWAVILAGGEGKRLLPLTRSLYGDDRPKQFCRILGDETLLDQTRHRVERVINPDQIISLVTKTHECYYGDRKSGTRTAGLLVQPRNRGTAPAIVYSVMRLREIDPDSVIGIFPSDHYFADDAAFADCIREAFQLAETHADTVILLGIKPSRPEPEYGWIEPGDSLAQDGSDRISRVRRFWEKPSATVADELMGNGCFWNSFVMVGHVQAFLHLIGQAAPHLLRSFQTIAPTFRTQIEEASVLDVYMNIPSSSFSHDVLAVCPDNLAVLCDCSLEWADIGDMGRACSIRGTGAGNGLPRRMGRSGQRQAIVAATATA